MLFHLEERVGVAASREEVVSWLARYVCITTHIEGDVLHQVCGMPEAVQSDPDIMGYLPPSTRRVTQTGGWSVRRREHSQDTACLLPQRLGRQPATAGTEEEMQKTNGAFQLYCLLTINIRRKKRQKMVCMKS